MSQDPTMVLLIQDNPATCRLIQELLPPGGAFDVECVDSLPAGLARLAAEGLDVVLLDLGLSGSHGLGSLMEVRQQRPDLPVVVLTGLDDEALGTEAVRSGAQDCLAKGKVNAQLLRRSLARRMNAVREEELTAVSREIHDQLGQALTGVKMDATWLAQRLPGNEAQLAKRMDSMLSLVDTAIHTVRNIAASLRPPVLDDLGIEAAIESHTAGFAQRADLEYEIDLGGGDLGLDQARTTVVFRILQEALTNVGRHADANRVAVSLRDQGERVVLEVRDDGRGISVQELGAAQSLGLLGMAERALAVEGQVRVERVPAGGTRVTLTLPRTSGGGLPVDASQLR